MDKIVNPELMKAAFGEAGFSADQVRSASALPAALSGDWLKDAKEFSEYWQLCNGMLNDLPAKPDRSVAQQSAAEHLLRATRAVRETFLAGHVEAVYDRLTEGKKRFVRVEEMAETAAALVPGLVPTRETLAKENTHKQSGKDGHEIDQGIFFGHVLANRQCAAHLAHAMLLPHPRTKEYLEEFLRTGRVDLGTAIAERCKDGTVAYMKNSRFMNAEDDSTVENVEIAVDLCLLDPLSTVAVLRGAEIDQGKNKGQRAFCSGVNLTHIYQGKLSYIWYLQREMGFINKIYRGLANEKFSPDEVLGDTLEKVWIAAIERFAIGGGCQYLLVMDINIAEKDAYLTLPARKEGIVPGAANMRLPRFVGDRIARQAIMADRRLDCDSPEGRMVCDYIVEKGEMDAAITSTIGSIMESGVVSASSNRKAMRVAQEPLDMFCRFMSVYAREQAYCHFSPALIRNLERSWDAQNRKI